YKDEFLQCDQLANSGIDHLDRVMAVVNISNRKVIPLEQEKDGYIEVLDEGGNDDYLLTATKRNWKESSYRAEELPEFELVGTGDGVRTAVIVQRQVGDI